MIQTETILKVMDNSGPKKVKCIRILGGGHIGKLGKVVICSVQKVKLNTMLSKKNNLLKGEICRGVIVGTVKQTIRWDGSRIRFEHNSVVLINKQNIPLSTRLFGPIPYEVNKLTFAKLYALAPYII